MLLTVKRWASPEATERSFDAFACYVAAAIQGATARRRRHPPASWTAALLGRPSYNRGMNVHSGLKALADPTRLRILEFLLDPVQTCCGPDDGVCSCDLETYLELTQPTVHHHMQILIEAGFVVGQRRGRWIHYALTPRAFRELATTLERFAAAAETTPRPGVTGRRPDPASDAASGDDETVTARRTGTGTP